MAALQRWGCAAKHTALAKGAFLPRAAEQALASSASQELRQAALAVAAGLLGRAAALAVLAFGSAPPSAPPFDNNCRKLAHCCR